MSMANQTSAAEFWPLVPAGLDAGVLEPFTPLDATAVAQAYELGFLNQDQLADILRRKIFPAQSERLPIFLRTASYIDRRRDISEELKRLAQSEMRPGTPLWMILARVIIQHYDDTDQALGTLEQLYQWCDLPAALRPYTLYATPNVEGTSQSRRLVDELHALLCRSGV